MTLAEQWHREGQLQERVSILTELLVLKFGSVSTEHEARITEATAEQLKRCVGRVLTAETIGDVFDA
jgi:hypothetical protein